MCDFDEPEFWDDDYDDRPEPEPNCFACHDSGFAWRGSRRRRCRACRPTRFELWRWSIRDRFRRRRPTIDDPWGTPF